MPTTDLSRAYRCRPETIQKVLDAVAAHRGRRRARRRQACRRMFLTGLLTAAYGMFGVLCVSVAAGVLGFACMCWYPLMADPMND